MSSTGPKCNYKRVTNLEESAMLPLSIGAMKLTSFPWISYLHVLSSMRKVNFYVYQIFNSRRFRGVSTRVLYRSYSVSLVIKRTTVPLKLTLKVQTFFNTKVCIPAKRPTRPALISNFCSTKQLGVFLLPPTVCRRCQSIAQLPLITHLYTWVERGTVNIKCLAQEHNTMSRRGLEPGPLDPDASVLTTRPPRLQKE